MKRILIFTLIFFTAGLLNAQNRLTLDDAISIALQKNSNLIKTKNNLESSKSSVKSAYGDLLPTLGGQGTFSWTRTEDPGGTQTDYFGNEQDLPASNTETRRYSAGIGGNWTLFNGLANIANLNQSQENYDAAIFSYNKLKQDIVLLTSQYYYQVINSQKLLEVRIENVMYNQKFLETVQERNKLGSVPLADVYAQQVQLGNAELLKIQAENEYENAKSTLLNYLALDVLEDHEFIDDFGEGMDTDTFLGEFKDIRSMVDEALANRPDYKAQKLTIESAKSGVTIAQSGLFPSLSGNYSYSSSATSIDNLYERKVFSAGLTLNVPVFSNWNTDLQIQMAQVTKKNAEEDLSALERQIKIEIKQGYLNLVAGKKSLDVATNNVKSAQENRRINYERYNLGSGTILDVLQSDRDYTDALRNKINAEFEFYRLKDALLNYLGQLEYANYE